jgi:hypothetical protein
MDVAFSDTEILMAVMRLSVMYVELEFGGVLLSSL